MNVTMHDVDRKNTYCTSNELCQFSCIIQSHAGFGHQELHPNIFHFNNKNPKGDVSCFETANNATDMPCSK